MRNLGYTGMPSRNVDGTGLGGVNAAPNGRNLADVSLNGSRQFDGSFSVLHASGVSLTMAGGGRDPEYRDPLGKQLSPNLLHTKLGYQPDFFNFGRTACGTDFTQQGEVIFAGDVARLPHRHRAEHRCGRAGGVLPRPKEMLNVQLAGSSCRLCGLKRARVRF